MSHIGRRARICREPHLSYPQDAPPHDARKGRHYMLCFPVASPPASQRAFRNPRGCTGLGEALQLPTKRRFSVSGRGNPCGCPISINLRQGERQEVGVSVGVRVVGMSWEGLYGRPLLLDGVARRPCLCLSTTMKAPMSGEAGDHKGPPILPSSTIAPTDVDELRVKLMPLGRPRAR